MRDKAFNIAKNPKYDGYQRGLASMVYKCFDKKTSATYARSKFLHGSVIKNENMSEQQPAEELNKPIISKSNKGKIQSPVLDNIWWADLVGSQI